MFSPKNFRGYRVPITYPTPTTLFGIHDSGRMRKTLTDIRTPEWSPALTGRRGGKYVSDGFPKNYFAYAKKTVDFTRQI